MKDYLFFYTEQLPEPLSQEEMIYYFKLYKKEDQNARNKLILHNIRLVVFIVSKMNVTCDKKDLVSLGIIGLIKSIDTFDVDKNYHFSSYAKKCILSEIISYFRKNKKYQSDVSFEENFNKYFFENFDVSYKIPVFNPQLHIENQYLKKETFDEIRHLITFLKEKEQKIICMYFGINMERRYTQKEIATKLEMDQGNLSRKIMKILEKLKKLYIMHYLLDNYSSFNQKKIK